MKARELEIKKQRKLGAAFYALAHNDFKAFHELEQQLKDTDVGKLCQEYIDTKKPELIDRAGTLLAGKHWYVALGR